MLERVFKLQDHEFAAEVRWRGSTKNGYRAFSRMHYGSAPPSTAQLTLSADPTFRGDSEHLNPEQLLTIAASSCLMLTFLSIAAMQKIEVVNYEDSARAVMPRDSIPMRITTVFLNPIVTIGETEDVEMVEQLILRAHSECFIANSLASDAQLVPTVVRVDRKEVQP
ncbi:OsmC family protein [Micromonospora sp. NPDC005324]|uniref:OsmC family protein n=1 Tax=Micromonospora sp. NPDC005324 TaxID=3157033 RepID=UPI0033A96F33